MENLLKSVLSDFPKLSLAAFRTKTGRELTELFEVETKTKETKN